MTKIRVGISACLLGRPLRYDGGHKLDGGLRDVWGKYVEWVPVCPETECGLAVPREPMNLYGAPEHPRLLTVHTGGDCTERMNAWIGRRLTELEDGDLCGFVLKKGSPSCGLKSAKVFRGRGRSFRNGDGLFARALTTRFPELPVVDEEKLRDPRLREGFLDRMFTAGRWRAARRAGQVDLAAFYTRHRLMVMKYSSEKETALAGLARTGTEEAFRSALVGTLGQTPGCRRHCRMMRCMLREMKPSLSAWETVKLQDAVSDYAAERVGLAATLALFRHYAEKYEKSNLLDQTCWDLLLPIYSC